MSLKALWRLHQPLKRTQACGFALRTLDGLNSVTGSSSTCLKDHRNCLAGLHHPTYNYSTTRLQEVIRRPHTLYCKELTLSSSKSQTWMEMRKQYTSTTTKSVLKQGGMPAKRTLKGPRTKQPSRTNKPKQEEVCHQHTGCLFYSVFVLGVRFTLCVYL